MILVALALAAGCGTGDERVALPDAGIAAATCGAPPEQPEIPYVLSTVDEANQPAVLIDRTHFDLLINYEHYERVWERCMLGH